MQLSVVIVNYNVCPFLELCLYSVSAALQGVEGEIIVVDNASSDKSRAYLPGRFPGVKFIWNETNAGFSKANNQGVAAAGGEYVLILNPDTLLPEDALSSVLQFVQHHPDAGGVGMRMYDGRFRYLPESKRGNPGMATAFFKLSGLVHFFPRHPVISRYYLGHLSKEEIQEVEVLAGAFMLIPRDLYEKLGGFDERFFMYGEDIDLSLSIRKAGYRNYYLPDPGIIHFKGESTPRSEESARNFYQAMQLFREKYGHRQGGISRLLVELAIRLRLFREAFRQKRPVPPGARETSQAFQICTDLTSYSPAKPTLFILGDSFGVKELFELLKKKKPVAPIRFKWRGSNYIVGSDNPAEKGEIIVE